LVLRKPILVISKRDQVSHLKHLIKDNLPEVRKLAVLKDYEDVEDLKKEKDFMRKTVYIIAESLVDLVHLQLPNVPLLLNYDLPSTKQHLI